MQHLLPGVFALLAAGRSMAVPTDTEPAINIITRMYGEHAAAVFELLIGEPTCTDGSTVVKAPCFSISQQAAGAKIRVSASSMSELTYGIGYYGTCLYFVAEPKQKQVKWDTPGSYALRNLRVWSHSTH